VNCTGFQQIDVLTALIAGSCHVVPMSLQSLQFFCAHFSYIFCFINKFSYITIISDSVSVFRLDIRTGHQRHLV